MTVDKGLPVLIVDDYETMLRIVRNLLGQLGFTDVEQAADGRVALARPGERPRGLIITDWDMRPMTGLDFLREVRADPATRDTPFIMVTAEGRAAAAAEAEAAGASGCMARPFTAATLGAKISSVLAAP